MVSIMGKLYNLPQKDLFPKSPVAKTPHDLLELMISKMKYDDVGYTSPNEIRKNGIANCWGASDFIFEELTTLNIPVIIMFLSIGNPPKHTHTTILYQTNGSHPKSKQHFNWFEWAWGKHAGIHPFVSFDEATLAITEAFKREYGKPNITTYHHHILGRENMTDDEYLKEASTNHY